MSAGLNRYRKMQFIKAKTEEELVEQVRRFTLFEPLGHPQWNGNRWVLFFLTEEKINRKPARSKPVKSKRIPDLVETQVQ